jgi:hypothetical protein
MTTSHPVLPKLLAGSVLAAALTGGGTFAQTVPSSDENLSGDATVQTPIGDIKLQDSYFDDAASKRLYDAMDYQRAAQAYIWSTPLVSVTTWRDNQDKAYGVQNATDFVVLESLKEKRGIVTANLTTPYIFNFSNLAKGPIQIDYPPGQTAGGVLDFWQRPVFDLGLTSPDRGQGGTYIVVGPKDDPAKYKKAGVHVVQSATTMSSSGCAFSTRIRPSTTGSRKRSGWGGLAARRSRAGSSGGRMSSGARRRRAGSITGASFPRSFRRSRSARSIRPGWRCSNRWGSPRARRSRPTNASRPSFSRARRWANS